MSPALLAGVEHVDAAEAGRRAAVAHRRDLPRLGLPAVHRAAEHPRRRAAEAVERAPEVRGGGLVGDVAQLPGEHAVLDPEEALAGELEVVALHVDRPGLVADDVDAALDARDEVVGGDVLPGGLQRDVGHPLDRHVVRGVGERAAVGAGEAEAGGEGAVELVADEHAVADEVPLGGGDAVVVEADGGEAVVDRAVAGDVHEVGAVAQRAELVGGGEAGARVGGLVADGAVVLGGVADRLVDGEPEVGRVDDQVVRARDDAGRLDLLGEELGDGGELGVEVPAVAGEVLPAPARGRGEGVHGLEAACGAVDGGRGEGRARCGRAAGSSRCPRGRRRTCTRGPGRRRSGRGRRRRRPAGAATTR